MFETPWEDFVLVLWYANFCAISKCYQTASSTINDKFSSSDLQWMVREIVSKQNHPLHRVMLLSSVIAYNQVLGHLNNRPTLFVIISSPIGVNVLVMTPFPNS